MTDKPRMLTREEIAHGRALLKKAFEGRWRYKEFEIECSACDADGECSNPECDGADVPCTFVEAPEAYPASEKRPQVVCTIEVPGISTIADANGEAICWTHNQALRLLDAAERMLDLQEALQFIGNNDPVRECEALGAARRGNLLDYAKSLGWKSPR